MSMKKFLNPEPLRVEVQDISGSTHIFEAKVLTTEDMNEIEKLTKNEESGNMINRQLVMMFGKDEKFYKDFDVRVLTAVLKYYTAEVQKEAKNPQG